MELLLQKGVNVNHKPLDGNSAAIWAAVQGSKENMEILVQNGADINQPNRDGYTPLIYAAKEGRKLSITKLKVTRN